MTAAAAQPDLARRRAALVPLAIACAGWLAPRAHAATLPAAQSLSDELAAALRRGQPLVVMASLHGCPFCRVVRDNYLAPLHREEGLAVVQLDLQGRDRVVDFDGTTKSHDEILRGWGVRVAPTVLFFGPGGREAAPRLAGASIPDFYGAYLDERLRAAKRRIG